MLRKARSWRGPEICFQILRLSEQRDVQRRVLPSVPQFQLPKSPVVSKGPDVVGSGDRVGGSIPAL